MPAALRKTRSSSAPAPVSERLRTRISLHGPDDLSDTELLSVLLDGPSRSPRRGLTELLETFGGLGGLGRAAFRDFTAGGVLEEDEGLRLRLVFELAERLTRRASERLHGAPLTPVLVAEWGNARLGRLRHEEVWALLVDGRTRLDAVLPIARGGAHGCGLLAKDILGPVLRAGAAGFVLVHNHPSGDPEPSDEDHELTRRLQRAALDVGTPLLDHVIVGGGTYRSLREFGPPFSSGEPRNP